VVRAIAFGHATFITRAVSGVHGTERTQAQRGEEIALDAIEDLAGAFTGKGNERQSTDGEDLIRANRGVDAP
jgi:hypothetical protein